MNTGPGKYRAKAREWDLGETGTGKEQIGISFDLLDHPGETITYYGYFTDAALPYTVQNLRTCGWKGADLTDLTGLDANEVQLVIEEEDYESPETGEVRTSLKVKFINSMGGLALKTVLDPNAKKAFAAKMRAKILGLDANGAKAHASKPPLSRSRNEPPPSDDIPF